jgi:hypothetical protein
MGFAAWWSESRRRAEFAQCALEMSCDAGAIARLAPEVAGMSAVRGAAYVLQRIAIFQESSTPAQARMLAARLLEVRQVWEGQGLPMPYWGNLAVLRTLQAEIAVQTTNQSAAVPLTRRQTAREAAKNISRNMAHK